MNSYYTLRLFILLSFVFVEGCHKMTLIDPPAVSARPCLISRVSSRTYYENYQPTTISETMKIDGVKYDFGPASENAYKYDSLGRITEQYCNKSILCSSYKYTKGKVIVTIYNLLDGNTNTYKKQIDTVSINNQGLRLGYVYNSDFNVIGIENISGTATYVWRSGNRTSYTYKSFEILINSGSYYDTTRLSLPEIYIFEGKISKNLVLADSTSSVKYNPLINWFGDGKTVYKYFFNQEGLVSRKIAITCTYDPLRKKYYSSPSAAITISDFDYICR